MKFIKNWIGSIAIDYLERYSEANNYGIVTSKLYDIEARLEKIDNEISKLNEWRLAVNNYFGFVLQQKQIPNDLIPTPMVTMYKIKRIKRKKPSHSRLNRKLRKGDVIVEHTLAGIRDNRHYTTLRRKSEEK